MTIPASAMITPLSHMNAGIGLVEPESGMGDAKPSTPFALLMQEYREFLSGMCRIIPCDITGTNVLSLTPVQTAPLIKGYYDHDIYIGAALNTSTGVVTATVVPENGTLATLKVFKTSDGAQATTGNIVAGVIYMFIYGSQLDTAAGGFVLK